MPESSSASNAAQPERRLYARAILLSDRSLEAKLAVLAAGDPLELYALGARRVRERCFYLDPDRVYDESVFQVTTLAGMLLPEDDFEAWLIEQVDRAIDNLLRRDQEALRGGGPDRDLVRSSGDFLSRCWGLGPEGAVRAALRFNGLDQRSRRTFFALLVEHRSVEACLEAGLGPRPELREHAIRSIEAILGQRPESVPTLRLLGDPPSAGSTERPPPRA